MAVVRNVTGGIIALALLCVAAPASHAASTDTMVEGAKLCTKYISRFEREYGIPTHLLAAIAATESGRYHKGLKILVPWPWTINVAGKGYYFDNKQEAIAAVKKYKARGVKSIDVGCMQVNMQHHPEAFASLEKAFEPEYNVAYAASFLRDLYQDAKSWKSAASHYHSKTPSRGKQYVGSVYNSWYQIIEKLRLAKLQKSNGAVSTEQVAKADTRQVTSKPASKTVSKTTSSSKSSSTRAAYKSPRMKVIELSKKNDDRTKQNGVIIVKPAITVVDTSSTVTLAKVEPAALTVTETIPRKNYSAPEKSGTVVRTVDRSGGKSGPTFIFSN